MRWEKDLDVMLNAFRTFWLLSCVLTNALNYPNPQILAVKNSHHSTAADPFERPATAAEIPSLSLKATGALSLSPKLRELRLSLSKPHSTNEAIALSRTLTEAPKPPATTNPPKSALSPRADDELSLSSTELMSKAFNVPREVVRKMQQEDEERGIIINVQQGMRVIRPSKKEEEQE
ncbi:hypothetical protein LguiB_033023 [Lonicera macranthoides]